MPNPKFRVKPYAHAKYKFVVRAKLRGKWRRRYFATRREADDFAREQNAAFDGRQQVTAPDGSQLVHRPDEPTGREAAVASSLIQRRAVVVLGMHRSGTSGLGGALELMGVDFGAHLSPPGEDNKRGYWEHPEIVASHDQLLYALGLRWDDERPLPDGWLETHAARETQTTLATILRRDFGDASLFGLKDPRMCRFMPLWLPVFEQLGVVPVFVLPVRHPWEVAESLAKRNGLDHSKVYALWLAYVMEAEIATRFRRRSFVRYDELLEEPAATLIRVGEELGLGFQPTEGAKEALRKFLERPLRHHEAPGSNGSDEELVLPALVREAYALMSSGEAPERIGEKMAVVVDQFAAARAKRGERARRWEEEESTPASAPGTNGGLVRLRLLHPANNSASDEGEAVAAAGSWQRITLAVPADGDDGEVVVAIETTGGPWIVDIAEATFKRASSNETLWSATTAPEFAGVSVGGSSCRLPHQCYVRILSLTGDTRLVLPRVADGLSDSALRLELLLCAAADRESLEAAVAPLREQAEQPAAVTRGHIEICGDLGDGYGPQTSLRQELNWDARQTVRFEHIEKIHDPHRTLRLRPSDGGTLVTLSSIKIIHADGETVVYPADSNAELGPLGFGEGIQQQTEAGLLLIASGGEAHVFLPPFPELGTGPIDLEVTLEPHSSHASSNSRQEEVQLDVEAASAQTADGSAPGTLLELRTLLEAARNEVARAEVKAADRAEELADLERDLEKAREEIRLLSSDLEVARTATRRRETALEIKQAETLTLTLTAEQQREQVLGLKEHVRQLEEHSGQLESQIAAMQRSFEQEHAAEIRAREEERAVERDARELERAGFEHHIRQLEEKNGELEIRLSDVQRDFERERAVEREEREFERAGFEHHIRQLEEKNGELEIRLSDVQRDFERERTVERDAREFERAGFVEHVRQLEEKNWGLEVRLFETQRGFEQERAASEEHVQQLAQKIAELEGIVAEARAESGAKETALAEAQRLLASERARLAQALPALQRARAESREREVTAERLRGEADDLRKSLQDASADLDRRNEEVREQAARADQAHGELASERAARAAIAGESRRSIERAERVSTLLDREQARQSVLRTRAHQLECQLDELAMRMDAAANVARELVPRSAGLLRELEQEVTRLRRRSLGSRLAEEVKRLRGDSTKEGQRRATVEKLLARFEKLRLAFGTEPARARSSNGVNREIARLVDREWYLLQYPDVLHSGTDPLTHFLRWGAAEGRNPNPLFDSAWYLKTYPQAAVSGLSAVEHYVQSGVRGGLNPHPLFWSVWYLEQNRDVAAEETNPLAHYLECGWREQRNPNALFDLRWYTHAYPEVAQASLDPLTHYLEHGAFHGHDPHPLFHSAWYLSQNPDVSGAGLNPLAHYFAGGGMEDPNPLFSSKWYSEQASSEVPDRGTTALEHYIARGAAAGRDPHPLFDTAWYVSQNTDAATSGMVPLEHYFRIGAKRGSAPHPLFDVDYYRTTFLADDPVQIDPVVHYLSGGWRRGCRPRPDFDPQFYLKTYPDIAEAGREPFSHYVSAGKAEGRMASAAETAFVWHEPTFTVPREPALPAEGTATDLKVVAFYLPQFHRSRHNDVWWGEGFTEWTNVRRGQPNFEGHYQPHVPSEFGYYDLEEGAVLEKQTQLARQAGIYGFCFYYYWFAGEVLLDLPVRRMVETGSPNFPFCICWANENWTRRWDGKESEILIAQDHSPEDDLAFIDRITPILATKNYIRFGGKAVLLVYRPSLLPDAAATLDRWRAHYRRETGGELHLVMVRSFTEHVSPDTYGFDAAVQFPPHFHATPVTSMIPNRSESFTGFIYDYREVWGKAVEEFRQAPAAPKLYPGVMPSWDNTARRRGNSSIWVNSSPEAYAEWLAQIATLAAARNRAEERFVFINAWNEWAEGCHLEPDQRYEYAWLNATSLALRDPALSSVRASAVSVPHPPAPPVTRLVVEPLAGSVKLVVSVLLYHREDILPAFLRTLLPQMELAASIGDVECELFLSFNYQVAPASLAEIRALLDEILPDAHVPVHLIENGFNLGFGEGHNAVLERSGSDIFLTLNSDLHVPKEDWLLDVVERFRTSEAAIVGLSENASRLREDACGIPVAAGEPFDFVDASVLAIRTVLAKPFGLFSRAFDYFYFEDVDLCLRYRQMGGRIELLDIDCEHERSSSSRLIPQFTIGNVLDRNRARFFGRWGKYLQTRTLPNRLGIRFLKPDRQLQSASLPAVFGLLAEHPTATVDISGLHEQLVALFQHDRIRLIPSWQVLQEEDYLRYYEVRQEPISNSPRAVEIAERLGTEPDFAAAREHVRSLAGATGATAAKGRKRALLYVGRTRELFEGKQPNAAAFGAVHHTLENCGYDVGGISEYGAFEVAQATGIADGDWRYSAALNAVELAGAIAAADLVVAPDGWAAELAQLCDKPTFVWFGAISAARALWNVDFAAAFSDESLTCLGCHERYGQGERNVCLRGDVACMRAELAFELGEMLERFDAGAPIDSFRKKTLAFDPASRSAPSAQLNLDAWPQSSAASVLVLAPVHPKLPRQILEHAQSLAERAISGMRNSRIVFDSEGEAPMRGVPHAERQLAMAALRQGLIERNLRDERWIFWVDVDIVDYPAGLIDELIARADGGIAAPLVLMEGDIAEPGRADGFGPGRFYDIGGFVENGRWARFTQPYFDQLGPVFDLDSVGSCYLVNADLYRNGAKHEQDPASRAFLESKEEWPSDIIKRNQTGRANSYTEHYSVCAFARAAGLPVRAFGDLIAYHQRG